MIEPWMMTGLSISNTSIAIVLAWMIYTILSMLNNSTTKNLPPWVISFWPFLGSALEFGNDCQAFLDKYFSRFQSPLFSAMIAGKVIHFVHYPDLTPERLFRFEKQLNFLPIANDAIDCLVGRRDKELTDTINTKWQANLIHQHARSQGLADMLQKAQRVLLTAVPDTLGESCYHGGLNDFVWKQLWPVSLAAVGAAESTSAIATEEVVPYCL